MVELFGNGICETYFPGSAPHAVLFFIAALAAGYLLGGLNFGVIISKAFYHDDVREHGSKGAGMTNMLRTYGKLPAALTFLGDGAKAVVAVIIGSFLLGYDTAFAGAYVGGLACILGHAFPVWYGFKGGRGIASGFFMVLCTAPVTGLICFALFLVIVAFTKYVSLGSVIAAVLYPILLYFMTGAGLHIAIAAFISAFVIYMHRNNIKRLIAGTENKIDFKKREMK